MSYIGDVALAETLDHYFTSRQYSDGAPTTLSGTPAISAYEDNSTTQITAGITLTADFDSVTGLNHVRVVATGANGFEAGKNYTLVITTGTVGGTSVVGEVIGQFSIEHRSSLRPTTAGRTLDVTAAGEAGIDLDNTSGTLAAAQIATDAITADKIAADAIGASEIAADAIGSSEIATTAVNEIRDAILADSTAFNGADIAAILTDTGTTLDGKINTIDTVVDRIEVDTQDIQSRLPAALVGGAMDSDVSAIQNNAITAASIATGAVDADAIATDAVNEIRDAILPVKNSAYNNIPVFMVLSSDHATAATGLTLTVTRSIDGGAFGSGTGTATEISSGMYQYDASAADMNGDLIIFRFNAATADDRFVVMRTGG